MSSSLVDSHCHLDLYPNFEGIIEECEREKIKTITVTTTPKAWPRNNQLTKDKKHVKAALGLHPQLVNERANEIDLWSEYLSEAKYIGEVGLDAGPAYYKSFGKQEELFRHILHSCKVQENKVLTIHSVRSAPKAVSMIEKYLFPGRCKAILHWFTGPGNVARKAIELGCCFSINSDMLTNPKHHDLIKMIPLDRMLTETDGPFTKINNVLIHPRNISETLGQLANLLSMPKSELQDLISQNFSMVDSG